MTLKQYILSGVGDPVNTLNLSDEVHPDKDQEMEKNMRGNLDWDVRELSIFDMTYSGIADQTRLLFMNVLDREIKREFRIATPESDLNTPPTAEE